MLASQKNKLKILCIFFYFFFSNTAQALFFERRVIKEPSLTYFTYPIAGNIPGIQTFYGAGATVSGIQGSGIDLTAFFLFGDSNDNFDKHGDGGGFSLNLLIATDIPLSFVLPAPEYKDLLTFSIFYGDGRNGAFPFRPRGIDSDKDDFNYILLEKFNFSGGEVALHFWEDQLEFYYASVGGEADPLGFVDTEGNFISAQNAGVADREDGGRYGIYLDDTDSRRDPRIGYRIRYERYDLPPSTNENANYYQEDYNITGFIPLGQNNNGILVLNQFYASSTVTKEGVVNPDNYDCSEGTKEERDFCEDRLETAKKESKLGRSTSLGGVARLRGYPSGRFYDSYTNFQGIEFRWYLLQKERSFDIVLERGVYTSLQLAFFYERGTVSPDNDSIWKNFKDSYGTGVRVLLSSLVFRVDLGFSDEGSETSVFVGYPF